MRITGQLVTRTQRLPDGFGDDRKMLSADGRQLVAVVGVLAVPPGHPLDSESMQFTLGSGLEIEGVYGEYVIQYADAKDLGDLLKGQSLGQALLEPIWRV